MATNRTPLKRAAKSRVTTQVLDVYRRALTMLKTVNVEKWEDQGGHRRRFLDLSQELDDLLGRKPWETSVLDCIGEPIQPNYVSAVNDWPGARALLDELERS